MFDPIILRAVERILAVIIGGLAVYLGYRLFLAVPQRKDSEGKLTLPGDISVVLSRVGPGVFFALFGTGVVVTSLHYTLKLEPIVIAPPGGELSRVGHQVAPSNLGMRVGYGLPSRSDLDSRRSQLRRDLRTIESLTRSLESGKAPMLPEQSDRLKEQGDAIRRIGLASLLSVWADDWGDAAKFAEWAKLGQGPPPDGVDMNAVTFYRQSQEVVGR